MKRKFVGLIACAAMCLSVGFTGMFAFAEDAPQAPSEGFIAQTDFEAGMPTWLEAFNGLNADISDRDNAINGLQSLQTVVASADFTLFFYTKDLVLLPETTYQVSFRYKIEGAGKAFAAATSLAAGSDGNQHWKFDKDGNAAIVAGGNLTNPASLAIEESTVEGVYEANYTFYTQDKTDYKLEFGSIDCTADNTTQVIIDDFRVYEGTGTPADFAPINKPDVSQATLIESIDFESDMGCLQQVSVGSVTSVGREKSMQDKINGKYSLVAEEKEGSFKSIVRTFPLSETSNIEKLDLKAYTYYTVSFRYKFLEDMSEGGWFYFSADSIEGGNAYAGYTKDNTNAYTERTFAKSAVAEGDYVNANVAFYTGNAANSFILFGMNGTGKVVIDDIRVFEGFIEGVPALPPAEKQEIPEPVLLDATESFEQATIGESHWDVANAGLKEYGYVDDMDAKINGQRSYRFKNNQANFSPFMTSAKTGARKIELKKETTYTVAFRYKIVTDMPALDEGVTSDPTKMFYVALGTSQTTGRCFFGWAGTEQRYSENGGKGTLIEKDGYCEAIVVLTAGSISTESYYLEFGASNLGEIILDDIRVFEGEFESYEDVPEGSAIEKTESSFIDDGEDNEDLGDGEIPEDPGTGDDQDDETSGCGSNLGTQSLLFVSGSAVAAGVIFIARKKKRINK